MKKIIIDCQKRVEQILDMTSQEENQYNTETQQAIEKENKEKDKRNKSAFLRASLELKEMKLNPLSFSIVDIAEKQVEVDEIKKQL